MPDASWEGFPRASVEKSHTVSKRHDAETKKTAKTRLQLDYQGPNLLKFKRHYSTGALAEVCSSATR